MPIIFISLNDRFTEKINEKNTMENKNHIALTMKIEDYVPNPNRKTYYVSPANSLCFMDGGIDMALSRIVFPDIEKDVKRLMRSLNIVNVIGRYYLPIGSSIIIDRGNTSLVVSPTMLLPQNVANTQNAYYATMAVLYNVLVNRGEDINNVDIIFTSLCCGYGKMDEVESITQIYKGIDDYLTYAPKIIDGNCIVKEPNLHEQPKYYQNTEFLTINPGDIVNC